MRLLESHSCDQRCRRKKRQRVQYENGIAYGFKGDTGITLLDKIAA